MTSAHSRKGRAAGVQPWLLHPTPPSCSLRLQNSHLGLKNIPPIIPNPQRDGQTQKGVSGIVVMFILRTGLPDPRGGPEGRQPRSGGVDQRPRPPADRDWALRTEHGHVRGTCGNCSPTHPPVPAWKNSSLACPIPRTSTHPGTSLAHPEGQGARAGLPNKFCSGRGRGQSQR